MCDVTTGSIFNTIAKLFYSSFYEMYLTFIVILLGTDVGDYGLYTLHVLFYCFYSVIFEQPLGLIKFYLILKLLVTANQDDSWW